MTGVPPNLALLQRLDLHDLDASADLFDADFVWHYVNRNLPDLEGDYAGVQGLKRFFGLLGTRTNGSFNVEPISAMPMGEEFVVVLVRDTLQLNSHPIALDALVVWRIHKGRFAEAWDIPAVYTVAPL